MPTQQKGTVNGFLLYCIFLIILTFTFGEIALRIMGYKPWEVVESDIVVEPARKFSTKNPTLGYTNLPGKFKVTLGRSSYSFYVTHLSNNLRATHPLDTYNNKDSKGEIWIFGCSNTYGWGVNDEQTYPWLVQERFPRYEVVNFGVPGYGTIHALIQLKEALKSRNKPEVAILAYASFHDIRNTYTRAQRKCTAPYNKLGVVFQPYAGLDWKGKLYLYMARLEYKEFPFMRYSAFVHWLENRYNDIERKFYYRSHDVSKALIKEMSRICLKNGIKFIVAGIYPDPHTAEMLEYCKKEGIKSVDVSIEYNKKNTNYPYDGHLSPLGHKKLAQKLIPFLSKILNNSR